MTQRAKVLTFSGVGMGRTQEEILAALEGQLEACMRQAPDLICFPEEILILGGDGGNPNWAENNERALQLATEYAAKLHSNIVINLEEPSRAYPGKSYNTAYVIDRGGAIIGKYRKKHITFRAIAGHGLPGNRVVTVDTDIGRLGLSICFDAGWREDWAELERQGAQLVVWPSAYHGGNLINGYAAVHMFYIVTSVWNRESRIISPLGDTIAQSSAWDGCAVAEVYPDARIYHFDHHESMVRDLRKLYGDKLFFRVDGDGNVFEMALLDPAMDADAFEREHGLQTYRTYHARSAADNADMLAQYPEVDP